MKKHFLLALLMGAVIISALSGCGSKEDAQTVISNQSKPVEETANIEQSEELTPEEVQKKEDFANSDAQNDTDTGLKNIKIDTAEYNLTDAQKAVLAYFDNDYLTVPSYEFLRRYPNVYDGAQMHLGGFVKKVLSATNEEYKLVLWLRQSEEAFFYRSADTWEDYEKYLQDNAGSFTIVSGVPSNTWFMEGDYIEVYGRYTGIETLEIDGISYTVPTICAHNAFISSDLANGVERYDANDIKTIAEAIFGDALEIRKPVSGEDYIAEQEWRVTDENPFYIVELENQSNAKFTKYRFYTKIGYIEDAKTGTDDWLLGANAAIVRNIEFSADFSHFFLFTYDTSLENLTLEYYDSSLNKIWKREFAETTSAHYDYTKNNIYLVANNEFYIINIETGEDTFSPTYIGERLELRKISDGIICISESKSDAVMKMDINGNPVWKTNLSADVYAVQGIQVVENRIILQLYLEDGTHYVVLDSANGAVLQDAVSLN